MKPGATKGVPESLNTLARAVSSHGHRQPEDEPKANELPLMVTLLNGGDRLRLFFNEHDSFDALKKTVWRKAGLVDDPANYVLRVKNAEAYIRDDASCSDLLAQFILHQEQGFQDHLELVLIDKKDVGDALKKQTGHPSANGLVRLTGKLERRGSLGVQKWQQRFFVLQDFCLFCFRTQEEYERKQPASDVIPMGACKVHIVGDRCLGTHVRQTSVGRLAKHQTMEDKRAYLEQRRAGGKYIFRIGAEAVGKREFLLRTKSPETAIQWVDAITALNLQRVKRVVYHITKELTNRVDSEHILKGRDDDKKEAERVLRLYAYGMTPNLSRLSDSVLIQLFTSALLDLDFPLLPDSFVEKMATHPEASALKNMFKSIPIGPRALLEHVLCFAHLLTTYSAVNEITQVRIAAVLAPILFPAEEKGEEYVAHILSRRCALWPESMDGKIQELRSVLSVEPPPSPRRTSEHSKSPAGLFRKLSRPLAPPSPASSWSSSSPSSAPQPIPTHDAVFFPPVDTSIHIPPPPPPTRSEAKIHFSLALVLLAANGPTTVRIRVIEELRQVPERPFTPGLFFAFDDLLVKELGNQKDATPSMAMPNQDMHIVEYPSEGEWDHHLIRYVPAVVCFMYLSQRSNFAAVAQLVNYLRASKPLPGMTPSASHAIGFAAIEPRHVERERRALLNASGEKEPVPWKSSASTRRLALARHVSVVSMDYSDDDDFVDIDTSCPPTDSRSPRPHAAREREHADGVKRGLPHSPRGRQPFESKFFPVDSSSSSSSSMEPRRKSQSPTASRLPQSHSPAVNRPIDESSVSSSSPSYAPSPPDLLRRQSTRTREGSDPRTRSARNPPLLHVEPTPPGPPSRDPSAERGGSFPPSPAVSRERGSSVSSQSTAPASSTRERAGSDMRTLRPRSPGREKENETQLSPQTPRSLAQPIERKRSDSASRAVSNTANRQIMERERAGSCPRPPQKQTLVFELPPPAQETVHLERDDSDGAVSPGRKRAPKNEGDRLMIQETGNIELWESEAKATGSSLPTKQTLCNHHNLEARFHCRDCKEALCMECEEAHIFGPKRDHHRTRLARNRDDALGPTLEELWKPITFDENSSFEQVMRFADSRACFRRFLDQEHSEENILFWDEVNKFLKEDSDTQYKQAKYIYDTFLESNAAKQINVKGMIYQVKDALAMSDQAEAVAQCTFVFLEAHTAVVNLLRYDSFPRFQTSSLFKKFCDEFQARDLVRMRVVRQKQLKKNVPRILQFDSHLMAITFFKPTPDGEQVETIIPAANLVNVQLSTQDPKKLRILFFKSDQRLLRNQKEWKLVFRTSTERERLVRLITSNLLLTKRGTISRPAPPLPLDKKTLDYTKHQLPCDDVAKELHETWVAGKVKENWSWGPEFSEEKKTDPHLVPYSQLTEKARLYAADLGIQVMGAIMELGFSITLDFTSVDLYEDSHLLWLVEFLAENVHNWWADSKLKNGWTYGEYRNITDKRDPNLIPYIDLTEDDRDQNRQSAITVLQTLLERGFKIQPDV